MALAYRGEVSCYTADYAFRWRVGDQKPKKPRKRKISKYKSVEHSVECGKNLESVNAAAKKIISTNPSVTMKGIRVSGYYGRGQLTYVIPESDEDFQKRVADNDRQYAKVVKAYERAIKEWEAEQEKQSLNKISKAVNDHEAAVNTIAEVLQKYPDVLDRAVAKAVKGR